MNENAKWIRTMYVIGIIALIIGVLDPLEGSVVVAIGSAFIAISTYLTKDRHWKIFLVSLFMIVVGVFFLFYFSSLGGFGGKSTLPWAWISLILPYPLGWLMSVITLITRATHKPKQKAKT